ncbi:hypothetical protein [Corynebacterium kozikiae]|uniref:hypothetical protein n=1 Tax=Corynebacterium kozikiae TaxID=2968469 RepID=UPI00211C0FEC|nr:hypothetical protein [Corynebacterium sp. 76QC2CO]MCQ9342161.1 hypothetical protein [Corynebacterium sp. 76QC2CO]
MPTMMKGAAVGIVAGTIAACSPGQTALMGAADVLTEKSASSEQSQAGESGLAGEGQQSGQNQGGNAGSGNETSGVGVDFDPNDPNFDFFDPCDGTTPEQKIAMGLPGEYEYADVMYEIPYALCDFTIELPNGEQGAVWLANDAVPLADLEGKVVFIRGDMNSEPDEWVLYRLDQVDSKNCIASVSTYRGRVQVVFQGYFDDRSTDELCNDAENYLSKLISYI